MIKYLTGGGLGDALMSIAKLSARPPKGPFKVFHLEVAKPLLGVISELYATQGIPHQVINIPSWKWLEGNRGKYDTWLGTSWRAENDDEPSWEIDPFPIIKGSKWIGPEPTPKIDVSIAVSCGRELSRVIEGKHIQDLVDTHSGTMSVALLGKSRSSDSYYCQKNLEPRILNYTNRTTLWEAIGVVKASRITITHGGFFAYLAGMLGNQVFLIPEPCSPYYIHPSWDVTNISLSQIAGLQLAPEQ